MADARGKSLLLNTSILTIGTVVSKGLMFLMTPVFAAWLTQDEYGTFDVVCTYVTLLVPFLTLSIGEALFRFLLDAEDEARRRSLVTTALVAAGVSAALSIPAGAAAFLLGAPADYAIAVAALYVGEVAYSFSTMLARGLKRLKCFAVGNIVYAFALTATSVVAVFCFRGGVPGLLLSFAAGDLIGGLCIFVLLHAWGYMTSEGFDRRLLAEMVRYSLPLIPNSISWWIMSASDRTVLVAFVGAEANAVYAVANKLPGLCSTLFNMFHLSWQQAATESLSDADRDAFYSGVFNRAAVVIATICILLLGSNRWYFGLLFSAQYQWGLYLAPVLIFAIYFSTLGVFIGGIYIAMKRSGRNGLTTMMAALVNLAVDLSLVNVIGVMAAPVSTLASYLALFAVRFVDIRRNVRLAVSLRAKLATAVLAVLTAVSFVPIDGVEYWLLAASLVAAVALNYSDLGRAVSAARRRMGHGKGL